ncbi:MAG: tRNA pseudouridine(55) synthase TruB [Prevotellaceae bacterium]|jgi:tRNA pseudouridine55 synthase|nr:tRNA pseudouridine(55) synthase TruB [Prevotellaceae bacterium]
MHNSRAQLANLQELRDEIFLSPLRGAMPPSVGEAILPFDKPYGWSSFDAIRYVQRMVQRVTGEKKFKIGHAGTLDPLATGLLVICIGKATRRAAQLQAAQKEYLAHVCLGAVTPSYDLETDITQASDFRSITREQVERQLRSMLGEQLQAPPQFSAKQVDGQRAYALARKGIAADVKPNAVTFYSIDLQDFDLPYLSILVRCSKGAYIRSFAHDLGLSLGCGAYLHGLRRTACGSISIKDCVNAEQLSSLPASLLLSDIA